MVGLWGEVRWVLLLLEAAVLTLRSGLNKVLVNDLVLDIVRWVGG